jgi:hypothetical protein
LALKEENTVSRYESREGAMEEGYRDVGAIEVVFLFEDDGRRLGLELLLEVELELGLVASTDKPRERRMSDI